MSEAAKDLNFDGVNDDSLAMTASPDSKLVRDAVAGLEQQVTNAINLQTAASHALTRSELPAELVEPLSPGAARLVERNRARTAQPSLDGAHSMVYAQRAARGHTK